MKVQVLAGACVMLTYWSLTILSLSPCHAVTEAYNSSNVFPGYSTALGFVVREPIIRGIFAASHTQGKVSRYASTLGGCHLRKVHMLLEEAVFALASYGGLCGRASKLWTP